MASEKRHKSEKGFEIKSVRTSNNKKEQKKYLGKQHIEDHFEKAFAKMEDIETKVYVIENEHARTTRKTIEEEDELEIPNKVEASPTRHSAAPLPHKEISMIQFKNLDKKVHFVP